ncbi:MAG TPA: aminotransferase class III-fold pyridoxal phosphate-dependent enzyme [bacterium]|nr:aminotransferase class III-fold pyridoxal phosphate-dependent enzyme [bacterium]
MLSGTQLYQRAKILIPGGTQLLSKRPEMLLPEYWPAYFSKAKGCQIWDLEGVEYTDMAYMGVGSNILGYADEDVDAQVKSAIDHGNISTLNAPEEVYLAEVLLQIHPWAHMVRYAKTGGEAMAIAVRIARASSNRDVVLFCGYHGWHDWYLSANLAEEKSLDGHLLPGLQPRGVPRQLLGTSFPFKYNDTEAFNRLIAKHATKVGAIVLETIRNEEPKSEFLSAIQRTCQKYQIPFIVDEISAGWRLTLGGAHQKYGIEPDIAVFAKAMSNGYPMSAIIGKKHVMSSAQDSFISSTYWTDRIGLVASLACIEKMRAQHVAEYVVRSGQQVKEIWTKTAKDRGVAIHVGGIDPIAHFSFQHDQPLVLKTLFTQGMLDRNILATTAYYASFAHKNSHIDLYEKAVREVFGQVREAIQTGNPETFLKGPVCHSGFSRLT